jgi:hypothetical protein
MPYWRQAVVEIERCCVEVRCARACGGSFFVYGCGDAGEDTAQTGDSELHLPERGSLDIFGSI